MTTPPHPPYGPPPGRPLPPQQPPGRGPAGGPGTPRTAPAPSRRKVGLVWVALGVVLVLVMAAAGLAWSQGWFAPSSPRLKPAVAQTFPDSFGDRNTRIVSVVERPGFAHYKDSSGREFTIAVEVTTLLLTDVATREKAAATRIFGGDVYCFQVQKDPTLCHKQLSGGLLTMSTAQEWDGERMATTLRAFYAQMPS